MNVKCITSSFFENYIPYFPDIKAIQSENENLHGIDLLILSGGGDVNPKLYHEHNVSSHGIDDKRDSLEINVVRKALDINPNIKIVGICRGLQILNVCFGGTLYQDLNRVGCEHKNVHKIQSVIENPFSWLTTVNSLHHQAIREFGKYNGKPTIMATEPNTGILEMVKWGRNSIGFQFHPEMFDLDLGTRFFDIIKGWVSGEVSFEPKKEENRMEMWHTSFTTNTTHPIVLDVDAFNTIIGTIEHTEGDANGQ
jgi:membrane dipeptidase